MLKVLSFRRGQLVRIAVADAVGELDRRVHCQACERGILGGEPAVLGSVERDSDSLLDEVAAAEGASFIYYVGAYAAAVEGAEDDSGHGGSS